MVGGFLLFKDPFRYVYLLKGVHYHSVANNIAFVQDETRRHRQSPHTQSELIQTF